MKRPILIFYQNKVLIFTFIILFFSLLSANAQITTEINPIAKKHLSQEQIQSMSINEIKTINFYFTSTFIVDITTPGYAKWLSDHDGVFDVAVLGIFRKQSERSFYRNENYTGLVVELFSWDEIQAETKKLFN